MFRTATRLGLAAALSLTLASAASAQSSVAGAWIFTMNTPEGQYELEFVFEQNGTEVTGTANLSAIPELEGAMITEGVLEDGVLFFVMNVSAQGQVFVVEMEADVTGDEMVGDAYLIDMGQSAPFTAKRKGQ